MSDDDQKLRVRLIGRNGRRRYEAASKERLVTACLEPGVSVSRLALEHGVNANLLRKWIKRHTATRSLPPSSRPAFIPV
ncbi:transposase, partial [Bradyrhizobium sp. Ai1a-2]